MSMSTAQADRRPDGHIILDSPVTLPDVLDLLIVGGGPSEPRVRFERRSSGCRRSSSRWTT